VIQRLKKAQKKREERSKEYLEKIVEKLKADLKDEKEYLEKCKKYNEDPKTFIDSFEITFEPLDVSAKTINGHIKLNEKLLDSPWKDKMRYVVHEVIHVMQQEAGKVDGKTDKEDYLDDPNEQEAFKAQISYMEKKEPPEKIQEYIEELLDHHNIEGKEREEKKEELMNE
jgi:hypothetical protein